MTHDPLDALYEPVLPVDPDPTFAAALRAQLAQTLLRGTGETMSSNTTQVTPPIEGDVGYASVWVPDVTRAEAFYGSVLGWRFDLGSVDQGRQVTGLPNQHIGMWGGQGRQGTLISFAVEDTRETVRRIRAAGGTAEEPTEEPYGLASMCADDQGMPFSIFQSPAAERGPAPDAGNGEIVYLTFEVIDSARFRAFFTAVFGWTFSQGRLGGDRFTIDGIRPLSGVAGGQRETMVVPQYVVDDLDAAIARVRAGGGSANEPQTQPYGRSTDCVDDQGNRFYLAQL
ncbi:MAG TPA: VOC family protein [Pseudonocardiaceae bacterium]